MKCALLSRLKEHAKGQTLTVEKGDIIQFIIMAFSYLFLKAIEFPRGGCWTM